MTMRDLHNNVAVLNALVPQTITTTAINTGNEDLFGFNSAEIVVLLGTIDGLNSGSPTGGTIDVLLEHSLDDGAGAPLSFENVALADVLGPSSVSSGVIGTMDENNTDRLEVGYVGDRRWLRVTLTPAGLGSGGPVAVAIIRGNSRHGAV